MNIYAEKLKHHQASSIGLDAWTGKSTQPSIILAMLNWLLGEKHD